MKIQILGGPFDGEVTQIPTGASEGAKFLVNGCEYFFNKPKDKHARLIYYAVSKED